MEPRELWERHSVLAAAFCGSDDQVREAQGILDEAQAGRTRMLAAFAVTVGSDCAVANLLGLNEREVRIARRTVGKDDARTVAKHLLTVSPDDHQTAGPAPAESPAGPSATGFGPHPTEYQAADQTVPPPPTQTPLSAHTPTATVPVADSAWSAALDAVLVGGWHTGLDLTALASEFGLELAHLVARAQRLSAEGRLNQPTPHEDRAGRHRRLDAVTQTELGGHAPGAAPGHAVPYPRNNDDITWQQISTHTPSWDSSTATQTDWNGIVSHWHHTAPLTQPWEPANQYT
ncbi:hypothetical protein ACIQVO_11810 [Streptomyces sp. NPDC101062]|uniref:hypothetical protein n=1 Tax=unclassified Streptomyces TaxID=2593676 RepID=UPI002E76BE24|nr:hypothetical protein [Streptomyces sp. JV176]MEE1801292.1 hypothetical protein [Streptomyces sp. JV176]